MNYSCFLYIFQTSPREPGSGTKESDSDDFVEVSEPSSVAVVFKKLFVSLVCAGLFVKFTPMFLMNRVKGETHDTECFNKGKY